MLKITNKKKRVAYLIDNAPFKVKKQTKIRLPKKEDIQLSIREEMSLDCGG